VDHVPRKITAFFETITQVSLADLWNGYFIGPPSWSAALHQSAEPRFIRMNGTLQEVLIIASNGGGVLYAAPLPSGEPILVLPNGGIEDGVYDTDQTSGFGPVAANLDDFLQRLIDAALEDGQADPFDPFNRR
jgi:hypothetical protein